MREEMTREPCEDAISRQEALNCFKIDNNKGDVWYALKELPSVNPQPKTGHWIIISPTDMYCSECNEIEHLDTSRRFCAYCGAKMVEPQKSEEQS